MARPLTTFDIYRSNKYSQNGEDGILAELIERIGIKEPGTCVEFGSGNGTDLSNTLRLIERGWRGVYIEADEASATKCFELAGKFPVGQLTVIHGMVGFGPTDCLDVLLKETASDLPSQFDVLSVDVDSHDLEIWRAVRAYRPKIVVIEINSGIALGVEHVHGGDKQGNSFTSMMKLAKEKDYVLVCHTGNLIFVAEEFIKYVKLRESERLNPEMLFDDTWVKWAKGEA